MLLRQLLLTSAIGAIAAPAAAQPASTFQVNLPQQPLDRTLFGIAAATGLQIVFTDPAITRQRAGAIAGRLSAQQMLEQALAGSGYSFTIAGGKTIRIYKAAPVSTRISAAQPAARSSLPLAQDVPADEQQTEEMAEIVVTGSRIEGSKLRGTLPVTTLDADRIASTGALTVGELTATIPQMSGQAFNNENQGPNTARGDVSSANLRGLGSGNTLTLLNGRRMVANPTTQQEGSVPVQVVNLNTIPVSAISRVEVLRDGAGAIYGSDATAGVINYLTDPRFVGLDITARYGFSEGTDLDEKSITARLGVRSTDGSTRLTVSADAYFRSGMPAIDRSYAATDNLSNLVDSRYASFFDNRSSLSPWTSGRVTTAVTGLGASFTTFYVQPCTMSGSRGAIPSASGVCLSGGSSTIPAALRYDEGAERTLTPSTQRYSLLTNFSHDFGGVELFSETMLYHATSTAYRGGSTNLTTAPLIVGANNPYNPFGSGAGRLVGYTGPAQAITIVGLRVDDVGPRRIHVESDVGRILAGFRGNLGSWKWETAGLYSWAQTVDSESNRVSNTALQAALLSSNPATAYNPFTGGNLTSPSSLDPSRNAASVVDPMRITVRRNSRTSLYLADARLTNASLFELRGNGVGIALGAEFRREDYHDQRDPRVNGTINYTAPTGVVTSDVLGTSPTFDTIGARNAVSAYAELAVPLVTEADNIPLVQNLELQLAGRFEHFSDIDANVFKPKVSAGWQVTNWLKLRGTYSQGFRAPNLEIVNASAIRRVQENLTDYYQCARAQGVTTIAAINKSACGTSRYNVEDVRSGTRNLKPENVESISGGVVFTPLRRLTVTADYWRIRQTNIVGIFEAVDHLNLDAVLRLEQASSNGALKRNGAGEPVSVVNTFLNLGSRKVEGVDVGMAYTTPDSGIGSFTLTADLAYLLTFYQSPSEQSARLLAAGLPASAGGSLVELDDNPRSRASGSISWRKDGWGASLFGLYVGPVKDTSALNYPVSDWFIANASISYDFRSGSLNGLGVRLGVNNIADRNPPLADETFGYYAGLYNNRGRFLYGQLSLKLR